MTDTPKAPRRRHPRKNPLKYTQGIPLEVTQALLQLPDGCIGVYLAMLLMVESPKSNQVIIAIKSKDPSKITLQSITRMCGTQLKLAVKWLVQSGVISKVERRKWWSIYTLGDLSTPECADRKRDGIPSSAQIARETEFEIERDGIPSLPNAPYNSYRVLENGEDPDGSTPLVPGDESLNPLTERTLPPLRGGGDNSPFAAAAGLGAIVPSLLQIPGRDRWRQFKQALVGIVGSANLEIDPETEYGPETLLTVLWLQEGEKGQRVPFKVLWVDLNGIKVEITSAKYTTPLWAWEDVLGLRDTLTAKTQGCWLVTEVLGELGRTSRLWACRPGAGKQIEHPPGWIRSIAPDRIIKSELPCLINPSWGHPSKLRPLRVV